MTKDVFFNIISLKGEQGMKKTREMDTRESLKVVTDNSFIVSNGLSKVSLKARKLLYLTIAQCRVNDDEFCECHIKVPEFARIMEIDPSNVYQEAFNITKELASATLTYLPDNGDEFEHLPVVSFCKYAKNVISIELNKRMTDLLLKLRGNFSQPLLSDFMRMRSPYSMAIWHLMQREMKSKKPGVTKRIEFYVSLEELRHVTGCEDKLRQLSEFKQRVFDKALREIAENCSVEITYTNHKESRTVVGFDCVASNPLGLDLSQYQPAEKTKNKIRRFELQEEAKRRELTEQEKKEYESLCSNIEQLRLDL